MDPHSFSYRYRVDTNGNLVDLTHREVDLRRLADVMNGLDGYFSGCDSYLGDLQGAGPQAAVEGSFRDILRIHFRPLQNAFPAWCATGGLRAPLAVVYIIPGSGQFRPAVVHGNVMVSHASVTPIFSTCSFTNTLRGWDADAWIAWGELWRRFAR